jgi:MFS family permease
MQPSRRWLMISFAFWATFIKYLDRQTLSVAAPVLREQFHLSNSGSVGAILPPPIVAWILLRYGWQPAVVSVGAVGLIWLALWLPAYRKPSAASAEFEAPPQRLIVLDDDAVAHPRMIDLAS